MATATETRTGTIRYYERIGLLPEPGRRNGYRSYDGGMVDRISFIKDAQATGLTLAEIGLILDMKDHGESTCSHVVSLMEGHIADVERQMGELARTKEMLEEMTSRARVMDPGACHDPNRCQTIRSRS